VLPDAEVLLRPVADGGEGTVAAALRARAWLWRERSVCRLSRSRTRGSSLLTR
jgi:glycerate kinase